MTGRLPATCSQHDGGLPPFPGFTLQPRGRHLVGLALRPRCQLVGALDHLSRQVEPILTTHPLGEQVVVPPPSAEGQHQSPSRGTPTLSDRAADRS